MKMIFSIIVPVHNIKEYLEACIESVIKQTFIDYEIILIDDGSTDGSGALCDEISCKYSRIKVIHQENQGLSAARNSGLSIAKGKYCIFLDSDDFLASDSLELLYKCIVDEHFPDVIVNRSMVYLSQSKELIECKYYFDKKKLESLTAAEAYRDVQKLRGIWLGAWLFSVKMEYLREYGLFFYPGILHEDEEWVPRMFLNAKKIAYNNEILYCYRIDRDGSITSTPYIKRELDKVRIIDILLEEFSKEGYSEDIREVVKLRVQGILFGTINRAYLYKSDSQYFQLIIEIKQHIQLLRHSSRRLYPICYMITKFFGVELAGKLFSFLWKLNNKPEK